MNLKTKPSNILYVHPSDELYGADRSLLRLVRGLDQQQFTPHVVLANDVPYEGLLSNELSRSGITYWKLPMGVLRRRYLNPIGVVKFATSSMVSATKMSLYCRKYNIQAIHTNSTAVMSGGLAARMARIPHIWHVREIITQPRWLNSYIAFSLDTLSKSVLAVSTPVKQNLISARSELDCKTKVIYNGIDPDRFLSVSPESVTQQRTEWGADKDTVIIGMVGRISSWKGQEFLLEAASHLLRTKENVRLVMVGGVVPGESWRRDELETNVKQLGIDSKVVIDSFRLDIATVLGAFDIFVLPSTRPDPFPTVVLEAMAAGKPVVATAHGGAIEQVEDGVTGLLVSPTDSADMTQNLALLIDNPQQRNDMGENGRARLLSNFTSIQYVAQIEQIYRSVLEL
jgi:glycosyltransferase involved in cell wall biosynthesis